MIVNTITIDGVDRVVWDSERGVITYDADGITETNVRPFTSSEQVFATDVVNVAVMNNVTYLHDEVKISVGTMLTGLTQVQDFANGTLVTNAQINANPAQFLKLVAAELVEVEQNLIAVARLASGQTDSTNTGA